LIAHDFEAQARARFAPLTGRLIAWAASLSISGGKLVDLVRSMAQGHSDVASRVHPSGDKPKDAGGVLWPAGAYYKLLKSVT